MESQGSGVQVLMSAKTALELGAPIRGIIAFTSTSTDKAGRSVPAPGRGALSIAREVKSEQPLPILNLEYRARQLAFRRKQIAQWLSNEQELLRDEAEFRKSQGEAIDETGEYLTEGQWLQRLDSRRQRIRGVREVKNAQGEKELEVVGEKIYLPNIIFTLVRAFEFELAVSTEDLRPAGTFLQRPALLSEPEKGTQLPMLIRPYVNE